MSGPGKDTPPHVLTSPTTIPPSHKSQSPSHGTKQRLTPRGPGYPTTTPQQPPTPNPATSPSAHPTRAPPDGQHHPELGHTEAPPTTNTPPPPPTAPSHPDPPRTQCLASCPPIPCPPHPPPPRSGPASAAGCRMQRYWAVCSRTAQYKRTPYCHPAPPHLNKRSLAPPSHQQLHSDRTMPSPHQHNGNAAQDATTPPTTTETKDKRPSILAQPRTRDATMQDARHTKASTT